jgi:hypothetical protein
MQYLWELVSYRGSLQHLEYIYQQKLANTSLYQSILNLWYGVDENIWDRVVEKTQPDEYVGERLVELSEHISKKMNDLSPSVMTANRWSYFLDRICNFGIHLFWHNERRGMSVSNSRLTLSLL